LRCGLPEAVKLIGSWPADGAPDVGEAAPGAIAVSTTEADTGRSTVVRRRLPCNNFATIRREAHMGFAKFIVILVSFLLAAGFLYAGIGGQIPLIEYKGTKATDVPIGIVFLVAGILIGKFWTIKTTTTNITEGQIGDFKFKSTNTIEKNAVIRREL
jgi:hypothetical protein